MSVSYLVVLSCLLCVNHAAPMHTKYPHLPLEKDIPDPDHLDLAAYAEEHLHLFENLIEPEQPFGSPIESPFLPLAVPEQPLLPAITPAPVVADVSSLASDIGFVLDDPLVAPAVTDADENANVFPDRAGFITGHRIPLELFSHATLMRIEDDEDEQQAEEEQAKYVDSSLFRRRLTAPSPSASVPEAPATVLVPPQSDPILPTPSRASLELPHADPIYPAARLLPSQPAPVPSAFLEVPAVRPVFAPSPVTVPSTTPSTTTTTTAAPRQARSRVIDESMFEDDLGMSFNREVDPAYKSTLHTFFVDDY